MAKDGTIRNICERLVRVETKVDEIAKNHLPTMEKRLNNIEKTVWIASGGLALFIIILQMVLSII